MINALLFSHGGYTNRGCEAIVRSTVNLLRDEFSDIRIVLASFEAELDRKTGLEGINDYREHKSPRRWTSEWLISAFCSRILRNKVLAHTWLQREIIKTGAEMDICLSIGGDNYCYGFPFFMYAIDKGIKKIKKTRLILWGASIEAPLIDKAMIKDLELFDLITARESITYETLQEHKLDRNLRLHPDPAFTMKAELVTLPNEWEENNMVGINISPLINRYSRDTNIIRTSVKRLMSHILTNTDCNIALIPHVFWQGNDDSEELGQFYEDFKGSNQVIFFREKYSAPQFKGIISKCRFFIGARTHATIAAYSTCVPTLALGYSVKARGIARDIFGDEKGLVLPVQELVDEKQLIYAFEGLREREKELRDHLQKTMPGYIESARQAVKHVRKLVEE